MYRKQVSQAHTRNQIQKQPLTSAAGSDTDLSYLEHTYRTRFESEAFVTCAALRCKEVKRKDKENVKTFLERKIAEDMKRKELEVFP